jgi:hypothetical protein
MVKPSCPLQIRYGSAKLIMFCCIVTAKIWDAASFASAIFYAVPPKELAEPVARNLQIER